MFGKSFKGLKVSTPYTPRKRYWTFRGMKVSPNSLKALKAACVKEGGVLNPFGQCGNTRRARYRATYFGYEFKPAFREKALMRKRIQMKAQRARALEAHEVQQIARENAKLAMETLVEISGNKRAPETTRIAASSVILDRAYGKASQTSITASITNGKASDLTATDLDKRTAAALKRVEELTNRAPKAGKSEKRPANFRILN